MRYIIIPLAIILYIIWTYKAIKDMWKVKTLNPMHPKIGVKAYMWLICHLFLTLYFLFIPVLIIIIENW